MAARLAQILEDMYSEAKAKTTSRRTLGHGLTVEVKVITSQVVITLQRNDNFPSMQEWDTVIKYFPYATPRIMPAPIQQGSKYLLTGKVPTQQIMQMKFG